MFLFEIGRDVEGIEVLEVLFRRTCGAGPPLGAERFFKDSIHPHVDQYRKSRELLIATRIIEDKVVSSIFSITTSYCNIEQLENQQRQSLHD